MKKNKITVLLTHLRCEDSTTETKHDDVYFHVYSKKDGIETSMGTYFWENTLKMNEKGDNNADINVELGVNLDFVDSIRISIRDKDETGHDGEHDPNTSSTNGGSNWDMIGNAIINRSSNIEDTIRVDQGEQGYGHKEATYHLSYRIIYKPIQTLRVLGLYCEKDSAGTDGTEIIDSVLGVAEDCCDAAAKAMGKSPRPRAKAISKGFKAASKILEGLEYFTAFLANVFEGADDVYMQVTDGGSSPDGGAFFPPSEPSYKMKRQDDEHGEPVYNDKNSAFFQEKYGHYFRFPLDKGDVTVQIKDKDHHADDCIGALTIKESDYDRLKGEGAQVEIAAVEWGNDNQGAVYQLCYSVGLEDWSKAATFEAQGEVETPDNLPEENKWMSIVNRETGEALYITSHSYDDNINISVIQKANQYTDQLWKLEYYSENCAWIINKYSEKVVCVQGKQSGNNAVQMYKGNYTDQRWQFEDAGDGYFYIINSGSKMVLQLGSSNVYQATRSGAKNQQWKFEKA